MFSRKFETFYQGRKNSHRPMDTDAFIERLKKMKAVDAGASRFGERSYRGALSSFIGGLKVSVKYE